MVAEFLSHCYCDTLNGLALRAVPKTGLSVGEVGVLVSLQLRGDVQASPTNGQLSCYLEPNRYARLSSLPTNQDN